MQKLNFCETALAQSICVEPLYLVAYQYHYTIQAPNVVDFVHTPHTIAID